VPGTIPSQNLRRLLPIQSVTSYGMISSRYLTYHDIWSIFREIQGWDIAQNQGRR